MRILVTGGAGFIGSAVVRHLINDTSHTVLNVDKLTYAGNLTNVASVAGDPRYHFLHADVGDFDAISAALTDFRPNIVMHLAAESHVDRSIDGPQAFVDTNIVGTYRLLEAARRHWQGLDAREKAIFRFHQVSTDEVFGSLGETGCFSESSAYDPRSPYSASKAAADHLASAWHHTFGVPLIITNCSNNYGPYHYPEKLIPLTIVNALHGMPIRIYGTGKQVRDWLHVEDHARGLVTAALSGRPGERYMLGGGNQRTNIQIVAEICEILDNHVSPSSHHPHSRLIQFVSDRPGHDHRYAVDSRKATMELGWRAQYSVSDGLKQTVMWYIANQSWWRPLLQRANYGSRIGVIWEKFEKRQEEIH